MIFIATDEPADATTGSMDAAFEAFKAKMASFDSISDTLCRGLDIEVEGWGTCSALDNPGGNHHGGGSSSEKLAFTGANDTALTFMMFAGLALLVAGGLVSLVFRRRARG
jgi:hypothetical protein